jgi:hypothetical protein
MSGAIPPLPQYAFMATLLLLYSPLLNTGPNRHWSGNRFNYVDNLAPFLLPNQNRKLAIPRSDLSPQGQAEIRVSALKFHICVETVYPN